MANGTRVDIHALIQMVKHRISLDLIVGLPAIYDCFRDVLGEMMGKVFFSTADTNEEATLEQINSHPLICPDILAKKPDSAWKDSSAMVSQVELMIPDPRSHLSSRKVSSQQGKSSCPR